MIVLQLLLFIMFDIIRILEELNEEGKDQFYVVEKSTKFYAGIIGKVIWEQK